MPANVKTYDGTGDPDDHLKIFESAATIENWPQPVWCHMFNSTLVGNARNWFSKLPRRSIDGFEELRRAFRLNFTQRKKCAKNPVELARVKQRQGESTSAYVERYKDECIHVKACPEILKISGFMNGINNPELIKRLNDRVPQTFDELMKRTRSFIQGEAAAADSRKGYSNNRSQEQSRRQSNDQSSSRNNSYRGQRGGRGNDKYTPLTMTPKEILATEGANFPRPPPMRTPEEQRVGNGYCEYHRQKGHTTNECVQLRQLIDKLVSELQHKQRKGRGERQNGNISCARRTCHDRDANVPDVTRLRVFDRGGRIRGESGVVESEGLTKKKGRGDKAPAEQEDRQKDEQRSSGILCAEISLPIASAKLRRRVTAADGHRGGRRQSLPETGGPSQERRTAETKYEWGGGGGGARKLEYGIGRCSHSGTACGRGMTGAGSGPGDRAKEGLNKQRQSVDAKNKRRARPTMAE
ncbi:reverse transcriptase domain-containing protein [Tanacetum coccineum]